MSKAKILCKWCDEYGTAKRAHIIPLYFFRKASKKGFKQLSKYGLKYEKVKRVAGKGIYDSQILCVECEEKIFAVIDDAVIAQFFQKDLNLDLVRGANGFAIHTSSQVLPELLYKFALSVLWRASVSKYYPNVDLGYYEKKVKREILDPTFKYKVSYIRHSNSKDPFWLKIDPQGDVTGLFLEPNYNLIGNLRVYHLFMGGYDLHIGIGKKHLQDMQPFSVFSLKAFNDPIILTLPFDESPGSRYMKEISIAALKDHSSN